MQFTADSVLEVWFTSNSSIFAEGEWTNDWIAKVKLLPCKKFKQFEYVMKTHQF